MSLRFWSILAIILTIITPMIPTQWDTYVLIIKLVAAVSLILAGGWITIIGIALTTFIVAMILRIPNTYFNVHLHPKLIVAIQIIAFGAALVISFKP